MWLRITEYDSARNEVVPLVKHLLASEVIRVDFVSRVVLGIRVGIRNSRFKRGRG